MAFQAAAIGGEIRDGARGNTAYHRRTRHGGRHFQDQARIKGFRDDVIRPENRRLPAIGGGHNFGCFNARECGNGIRCCHLHFFIDGGRTHIQRTTENEGKAENIIDLIRIIRPPGRHNRIRARGAHRFGQDFWLGIRQRQDQGVRRQQLQPFRLQDARCGKPQEDISAGQRILQGARIGLDRPFGLVGVKIITPRMHHAANIADGDVFALEAHSHQQIKAGKRRRTTAGIDQAHIFQPLALQQKRIAHRSRDNNRRAMLIIMKNRNAHAFAQAAFHFKAFGRLDVFQIDRAEGRLQRGDHLDQLVGVFFVNFDVNRINAGEFLE